jgi:hypothetical protein
MECSILYILEPVSVGGWTKIRLRRIARSSTCVCMRIRNYFFFAARSPHSNFALAAVAAPCCIPVLSLSALSRDARSRGSAAPPRLRAARTPTPITCAHCSNGFLYQFGVQSRSPTPISSTHCPNECQSELK